MNGLSAQVELLLFAHERPAALEVAALRDWRLRSSLVTRRFQASRSTALECRAGSVGLKGEATAAARWQGEGDGPWRLRAAGRVVTLRGDWEVSDQGGNLRVKVRLPLEDYVAGVLPAEITADAPAAALAAQAVCVRSFTWRASRHPRHEAAWLCDATHCQRFRGTLLPARWVTRALAASAHVVRTWDGQPALTVWHASCGGHGASAQAAFGGTAVPYLLGGRDTRPDGRAWCEGAPGPWRLTLPRDHAEALWRSGGLLGPGESLVQLSVDAREPDGRVRTLRWAGHAPRVALAREVWPRLGPTLPWPGWASLRFDLNPTSEGWQFTGQGLGHGVGLCQAGASARARSGWSFARILDAYFPGTRSAHWRLVRGQRSVVPSWADEGPPGL
ncbi:MAG: SpoIID/LytB domain-containing protein [Candidatus Sericytochromatia bacterium]|nr:SpoIID/LytB domain-containing protein [Candidatus Sericytochromatia bacterium]